MFIDLAAMGETAPVQNASHGPSEGSINQGRIDQEASASTSHGLEAESQQPHLLGGGDRQVHLLLGGIQSENSDAVLNGEEVVVVEEEEEEECGFCLFMKGGACRERFINWEECVKEVETAKGDFVAKCYQVTMLLKECMESNADYYEPVLKAEKELSDAADEEATTLQEANVGNESEETREGDRQPSPPERQQENLETPEQGSSSKQPTELQNSEEDPKPSQD